MQLSEAGTFSTAANHHRKEDLSQERKPELQKAQNRRKGYLCQEEGRTMGAHCSPAKGKKSRY